MEPLLDKALSAMRGGWLQLRYLWALYLVIREDDKEDSEGEPKYPRWLPKKYRTLKGEVADTLETATETFDSGMEQKRGISTPLTETSPLEPVAATTNNCSSSQLNLEELEEKIRRGFNLTRDFYECGKSLVLVRDHALYEPEFTTFEEYCEKRFGKSVRAAQYFMSAASLVDNLLNAECAVIPTAESQVRAIASLPAHQQVEIWQQACRESKGVPIAAKVREVKAVVLGEAPPSKLSVPPVTSKPEILLSRLKERVKSTKVSLKDIEVLLELIQEFNA